MKKMKELCENIYKKSRKNAGIEQIDAADALGVSARSLQNYESELNTTVPPLDIVRGMCILYKDRGLAYKHIKKTPIGEFMPDFDDKSSLPMATLGFIDDFNRISKHLNAIISIAKDSVIDSTEENEWKSFQEDAMKLINSLHSLINVPGTCEQLQRGGESYVG